MDRKLLVFLFYMCLVAVSLAFGANTKSVSQKKRVYSPFGQGDSLNVYFFCVDGCPDCVHVLESGRDRD